MNRRDQHFWQLECHACAFALFNNITSLRISNLLTRRSQSLWGRQSVLQLGPQSTGGCFLATTSLFKSAKFRRNHRRLKIEAHLDLATDYFIVNIISGRHKEGTRCNDENVCCSAAGASSSNSRLPECEVFKLRPPRRIFSKNDKHHDGRKDF